MITKNLSVMLVEDSRLLTDRLHEFMAFLEAGDPCKRGTDLGPLSSAAALTQVEDRVGGALRRGMSLKLGGRRYQPWGLPGYFFQPTILVDRSVHEDTSDDHIGGPVAIVCPVPDLATAVRSRSRNGARALVALFADDPAAQLRPLEDAGRAVRISPPLRTVDRTRERVEHRTDDADHLVIELIAAAQADWFPYHRRPPQSADSA